LISLARATGPLKPPTPPENVVGFSGPVARTSEIKIDDYSYAPLRISVAAGTKVKFTNNGVTPHNANSSDSGGWDTGLLAKGESATVTFNQPGTYTYTCTPHPSMLGQIIVTGQAAQGPPTVVEGPAAPPQPVQMQMQHGAH